MSDEEPKGEGVIEERTRRTLGDVRWLLVLGVGSVVGLFGGGWKALAQVREVAREEARAVAKEETAGVMTELEAVKVLQKAQTATTAQVLEEMADTRNEVRGLRRDLRTALPKIPPLEGE